MQALEKITVQLKQLFKQRPLKTYVTAKDYKIQYDKQEGKITLNPTSNHLNTIIWLHGLGDSAQGFYPIFSSQISPVTVNTKVILPTAPIRPVTINGGYASTSWYDIYSLDRNSAIEETDLYDQKQVEESYNIISDIVSQEIQLLKGDSKKVYLGGFSQGGAMALYTASKYKQAIGGVFCLSGYLFESVQIQNALNIGLMHGRQDMVVPFSYAWNSFQRLENNNKNHHIKKLIEEDSGHEVTENELQTLSDWFQEFLELNEQTQNQ